MWKNILDKMILFKIGTIKFNGLMYENSFFSQVFIKISYAL